MKKLQTTPVRKSREINLGRRKVQPSRRAWNLTLLFNTVNDLYIFFQRTKDLIHPENNRFDCQTVNNNVFKSRNYLLN